MHKIYISNKAVFLNNIVTEEIEEIMNRNDTIVIKDLTSESTRTLIEKMAQPDINAGVFLNTNVDEILNTIKRKFYNIQAAGGLVHSNKNDLLLIFRRGKWDLPKGKIDEGESLEKCAVREVQEETGLKEIQLQQSITTTYHTYYEDGKHCLKESHWFLMLADEEEPLSPQTEEDIEKCEWVKIRSLPGYTNNAHASVVDVINAGIKVLNN